MSEEDWFQWAHDGNIQQLEENVNKYHGLRHKSKYIQDCDKFVENATALMEAVFAGQLEAVKLLSKYELGLYGRQDIYFYYKQVIYSAFTIACYQRHESIALLLIDEAQMLYQQGWNELRCAACVGLFEVAKILAPTYLLTQDKDDETAFAIACKFNHENIALLLIEEAQIADNRGWNGLMKASYYGFLEVVKALIPMLTGKQNLLGKQNNKGQTAFAIACQQHHESIALLLTDEAQIKDDQGWNGLMWAIEKKMNQIVQQLDPQHDLIAPSQWFQFAKQGNLQQLEKYANTYCKLRNDYGITALMEAAGSGQDQAIQFLQQYEIGLQSDEGSTALMTAIRERKISCAKLLLGEVAMKDKKGNTALMYAARSGQEEAIKLLSKYEIGLQSKYGETALMDAITSEHVRSAELLLDEVSLEDSEGNTALMYAAKNHYVDGIKLLAPISLRHVNKQGETALFLTFKKFRNGVSEREYFENLDVESINLLIGELDILIMNDKIEQIFEPRIVFFPDCEVTDQSFVIKPKCENLLRTHLDNFYENLRSQLQDAEWENVDIQYDIAQVDEEVQRVQNEIDAMCQAIQSQIE